MKEGVLLIMSGPSGCGKGTICKALINRLPVEVSISATTREPRGKEVDGVNYFFKSHEEFNEMIENDMLLEYAEFCGNKYGTPKQYVSDKLKKGKDVLLEIEVCGALQVKEKFPEAVLVFLMPPSMEELRRRIDGRKTETKEVIEVRMKKASDEVKMINKYDYVVVNDKLNTAVEEVIAIIRAEHLKANRANTID